MERNLKPLGWPQLREGWKQLPWASRLNYLDAAAACLHDLWRNHADLADLYLDNFGFRTDVGPVSAELQSVHIRRLDRPMSQSAVLELFAHWQRQHADVLSPRDFVSFLRSF